MSMIRKNQTYRTFMESFNVCNFYYKTVFLLVRYMNLICHFIWIKAIF